MRQWLNMAYMYPYVLIIIQVVNVFTLWSILLFVDYQYFSLYQLIIFTGLCSAVIVYEIILGIVRVQDYFHACYFL